MGFVDDDEFEIGEEFSPIGVVRQDARMQHVGILQHDAGGFADGGAMRSGYRHRRWRVSGSRYQVPGCGAKKVDLG